MSSPQKKYGTQKKQQQKGNKSFANTNIKNGPEIGQEKSDGYEKKTNYCEVIQHEQRHGQLKETKKYWIGYFEPLVVVTFILAIVTGLLYYEASNAGKDARQSPDAAKEAADVAKSTLDEYKEEFKTINTPYLAANHFTVNAQIGKMATVTFSISNLGIATQKIIKGDGVLYSAPEHDTNQNFGFDSVLSRIPFENRYVAKDNPEIIDVPTTTMVNQELLDKIKNGDSYFYFYCLLIYINEATNRQRRYSFFIRFYPPSHGGYYVINNENKDFN